MVLTNNGEYMGEGTPADVINEICERSRIGLVSALADRIDFNNDYILSFREDAYERITENGNLMHGIKMMVSADPLVRCKECKYEPICNHSVQHTTHDAHSVTIGSKTVEWCSYGERKEGA